MKLLQVSVTKLSFSAFGILFWLKYMKNIKPHADMRVKSILISADVSWSSNSSTSESVAG